MTVRPTLEGAEHWPIEGAEIVHAHSGKSSEREWSKEHSMWLRPGDFILRDRRGQCYFVHVRPIG